MKKILIGLLALTSLSSFSATLNLPLETTVEEALLTSNCAVVVKNKPILFLKGRATTSLDQNKDIVLSLVKDSNITSVRRLAVGRTAIISGLNDIRTIGFSDTSVSSLYSARITFREMTLGELTQRTEGNIVIECSDSTHIDV